MSPALGRACKHSYLLWRANELRGQKNLHFRFLRFGVNLLRFCFLRFGLNFQLDFLLRLCYKLRMEENEPSGDLGWHTMSGEFFLACLRRVAAGEDPDLVYLEAYANAEREDYRENDDEKE